jgi:REP element-mobilizing transposase RayT
MLAVNGERDHIHVFIGLNPAMAISDLVRDVKAGSSGFINEKRWVRGHFNWQEGCGAFSKCTFTDRYCCEIHPEPAGASQKEDVQGRYRPPPYGVVDLTGLRW